MFSFNETIARWSGENLSESKYKRKEDKKIR